MSLDYKLVKKWESYVQIRNNYGKTNITIIWIDIVKLIANSKLISTDIFCNEILSK